MIRLGTSRRTVSAGKCRRIRVRGWRIPHYGPPPAAETLASVRASQVALLGREFHGTRLDVLVAEGEQVAPGAVVMRDRRHPEIAFTTPAGGVVSRVRLGARRALDRLEITVGPGQSPVRRQVSSEPGADEIRNLMLESGIWSALRTRPYGFIPLPKDNPAALFVTAIDSRPLAPDPAWVIGRHADWFRAGLVALDKLNDAPLYLCCAPDTPAAASPGGGVRVVEFAGPHPAGLPGVHIQACCPVGAGGRSVWQINYQTVLSMGRLVLEGLPWFERIVSVAGAGFSRPGLIEVTMGASIGDVVAHAGLADSATLIAGSPVDGKAVRDGFLEQRQIQLSAVPDWEGDPGPETSAAWPLIPTTVLDDHAPPGIHASPLIRALLVGDADRARELGALELLEEDLAGISVHCSTGTDFGMLLRRVIDRIAGDEA